MVYNSFYVNILVRVILLLGTLTGISYLFVIQNRFFTLLFLVLLAVVQVFHLFFYLNRTNKNLARFLLLLTQEDTSVVLWKDRIEKTFKGLHHSFRQVNEEISRARKEREKDAILLQRTMDHMAAAILVSEENGVIRLRNEAASRMFGIKDLDHIKDLDFVRAGLSEQITRLRYDSGNVIRLEGTDSEITVMVRVSHLNLEGVNLRLYALQDIKNQVDALEIDSWQKMTRVLTHEISNSLTPISTLGEGIRRKLSQGERNKEGELLLNSRQESDLIKSADLLGLRSDALVDFMEHYKSFSRIPDPSPEKVEFGLFLENIALYFQEEFAARDIRFIRDLPEGPLQLQADPALLEQAFINLVRNSMDALEGRKQGQIVIRADRSSGGMTEIRITDNGSGIAEDIRSQLFIPFFTTRAGGTGIGLSIVRKIVLSGGGTIEFDSEEGSGTTFVVKMPDY